MSSMSADDFKKWGPSTGFAPDSAGSVAYSAVAAANGDGTSNNFVNPAAALAYNTQIEPYNSGLLKRLQSTGYSLLTSSAGYNGHPEINTTGLANQIGKNYSFDDGVANAVGATARKWNWNILATIRLNDLADFFDKIPLVKGAFMKFTIDYNTATTTITSTAGPTLVTASITQLTTILLLLLSHQLLVLH